MKAKETTSPLDLNKTQVRVSQEDIVGRAFYGEGTACARHGVTKSLPKSREEGEVRGRERKRSASYMRWNVCSCLFHLKDTRVKYLYDSTNIK